MVVPKVKMARSVQKATQGSEAPRSEDGRQCSLVAMFHTSQISLGSLAKGKHRSEAASRPVEEPHLVCQVDLVREDDHLIGSFLTDLFPLFLRQLLCDGGPADSGLRVMESDDGRDDDVGDDL